MPFVKCPACGKNYSDRAPMCPHCNQEPSGLRQNIPPKHAIVYLIVALCGLAAFISYERRNINAAPPPSRPLMADYTPRPPPEPKPISYDFDGKQKILGSGNVGCIVRDNYAKMVGYAANGDKVAFAKALTMFTNTGDCLMFKDGEPVFVSDTAIFSGLVQLRREGDLREYWTDVTAISKPD